MVERARWHRCANGLAAAWVCGASGRLYPAERVRHIGNKENDRERGRQNLELPGHANCWTNLFGSASLTER